MALPLFRSLSGYRPRWLRADLVAGLTVWAVLVPESLAYATIAGVPPVVGLYAAVPALVVYAAVGSSRHLVVGPMSGTAALSASIVAGVAASGTDDYVATTVALGLVVGVLALLAGFLRLGFLSAFISEPVLKGFIIGLALTIIVGQVPSLLGIEKEGENFFEKAWYVVLGLGDVHPPTLLVGAGALALILLLRRVVPIVPGSLLVVLLGIGAAAFLDLEGRGVELVGSIEAGLPAVGLPDLPPAAWLSLVGPALGVLLIAFVEGLGAAKAYAATGGYQVDPDRELVGLGAANVGSGLMSGMVVNGSLSKTAVNVSAGARTQAAGLAVAGLTVLTLLFLTGLFETLPEAVLAAVVIAAVVELVDLDALRELYAVWSGPLGRIYRHAARADFIGAVGALVGVLVLDTLPGLCVGVLLSLLTLLYRVSRPYVARLSRQAQPGGTWVDDARHDQGLEDPRVVVARVESGLFFANADHVRDQVGALLTDRTQAVVIDGRTMPFVDVTGAVMLRQLGRDLASRGVTLSFAHPVGQVRDVLDATGVGGQEIVVRPSVDAAVESLDLGREGT